MSAYDPFRPQTQVGPHRVFVDPPPDPASEVPGHPDELLAWLRQPGGDLAERARRVDLAEEVEMGRPGRMRDVVLDAIRWNRAVITGEVPDGDDSWTAFEKTASATGGEPLEGADIPDGATATLTDDGTVVVDEATVGPDGTVVDDATVGPVEGLAGRSDTPASAADGATYSPDDVPANAKDIVAWIQAAPDEADAAERSQAAWLVEIDRPGGVRSTVRAEIDRHLA